MKRNNNPAAIPVAVVGVGYLGKYHVEKYSRLKKANLVALVDTNLDPVRKLAKKNKAEILDDFRKLPDLGVKCASVVTPTSTHFEIASWLLENGVDVLVEKPIAGTVEEGRKLVRIAEANQRILQVGHLERFNPAFRAIKEVLSQPRFFEVRRITPFSGRGVDVDVVRDLMIHDLDIVSHLAGAELERLEAVGTPVITHSCDIANARLTFKNGAVANITSSRAAFKSERTIRIFQPEVYISLDFGAKAAKIYSITPAVTGGFPSVSVKEFAVGERDALEHEIESFLDSVATREPPEVKGEDGLRALVLAEKIAQAIETNQQIHVANA